MQDGYKDLYLSYGCEMRGLKSDSYDLTYDLETWVIRRIMTVRHNYRCLCYNV